MNKIEEAKEILTALGMGKITVSTPYCLLSLAGIKKGDDWSTATGSWQTIRNQMDFMSKYYRKKYAPNSRESIRKQSLHPLRTGAIIEDNTDKEATNSQKYAYKLTDEALSVIRTYGTASWEHELKRFLDSHDTLVEKYTSKKVMAMQPININGKEFLFSSGDHNRLQKAIVEQFAPRFAPGCECLYIGDSAKRDLFKNETKLQELGFEITLHDKMPDVVLYRNDVDWIYFIEAVTSVGPMNPKRVVEISELTKDVKSGMIFITAFLDFDTYKAFSAELAWETEVWLASSPDHMIHLNGDRFMGPRSTKSVTE